ncbi:MAG: nucleotidyltransferase domain-containing protein [Patescibacteria group bacterium]
MKSKLPAYALDFVSFLLEHLKQPSKIIQIILFGSVSRGEDTSESDVDLFIDVISSTPVLEKEISLLQIRFLKSTKYLSYWKPLGITSEIKPLIGKLQEWKSLYPSLVANGIVLYGKFQPPLKEGQHYVFFVWENVFPNTVRVLFNKQLFGYTRKKKFYLGLLQKYQGERLGKGCILVPLAQSTVFHTLFKKYKITVKIKKVLVY